MPTSNIEEIEHLSEPNNILTTAKRRKTGVRADWMPARRMQLNKCSAAINTLLVGQFCLYCNKNFWNLNVFASVHNTKNLIL